MTRERKVTLAYLAGSSAVRLGSNTLAALLASRVLGPHGRGLMVLGVSMAVIVPVLTGLGTGPRLRSRIPSLTDPSERRYLLASYAWWSVTSVLMAIGLVVVVAVLCAPVIDRALAEPRYLLALSVLTCGYVAHTQLPDLWYAVGLFRIGSGLAILAVLGGALGLLVGTFVAPTASGLLLAQGIGLLVGVSATAVRLRTAGLLCFRRPRRRELKDLLRHGCRALGLTIGLPLALQLDRYVLGSIAGAGAVGVYSVASTLGQVPRLVPNAIGQIVNRDVATDRGSFRPGRAVRMGVASVLVTSALVAVAGWLAIVPLLGPEFAGARPLLVVFLLAEIVIVPYTVASPALLGGGWMGTAGAFGLVWSAVALVLYVTAIRLWGSFGAAAACVVLYAGISGSSWLLLLRHLARSRKPDLESESAPLTRV